MARDDNPWQVSPTDVKTAAKDGKYEDCLACKVTGASLDVFYMAISDCLLQELQPSSVPAAGASTRA